MVLIMKNNVGHLVFKHCFEHASVTQLKVDHFLAQFSKFFNTLEYKKVKTSIYTVYVFIINDSKLIGYE